MHERTVLVFTGGGGAGPVPEVDYEFVIAADSGLTLASGLGWRVDLVVGDMDSVDPAALEEAAAAGAQVERHDRDKDRTDLELALAAARRHGADRVHVAGGAGGRLDHVLANALCLAADDWSGLEISATYGAARVWVVRVAAEMEGGVGDLVSLVPVGGPAHGVHTTGLRWHLAGDTLAPASGRGISNEFAAPQATVSLAAGTLLAVAPGPEAHVGDGGAQP